MTKHLTVILGMHRSGTSLLAAGLSHIGENFGSELMGGSKFNLKGHWEDNDIVAFNNRVLSALNITWDSTKFIDDNAWHHNEIKSLVDEGVLLIEQKLTINDKRFAFKDPRTIRVLPIWLSIFKKLNIAPRFVVAFRNPLDVGVSLTRREAKPLSLSQLLWMHHHFSYLKELMESGYSTTFIDFYDFCKQPKATLIKLAEFLEFSPKSSAIEAFSEEFYDEKLVTKQTDPYQLSENKRLIPWIFDNYRYLRLMQEQNNEGIKLLVEQAEKWREVGPFLCSQYTVLQKENLNNQQVIRTEGDREQQQLKQQIQQLKQELELLEQNNITSAKDNQVIDQVAKLLSTHTDSLIKQITLLDQELDTQLSKHFSAEIVKLTGGLQKLATSEQVVSLLQEQSTKQDIASLINEIKANSVSQPLSEIKEQLSELVCRDDLKEVLTPYQAKNEQLFKQTATAYKQETQSLLGRIDESSHAVAALQKQQDALVEKQQAIVKLREEAERSKEAALGSNMLLKHQQQVLDDVYDSYSWRITSPLRKLVKLFIG